MYSACAVRVTLDSCKASKPLMRLLEREGGRRPLTASRVFSLEVWVESSQTVLSPAWCSQLGLTTGVHLAFERDKFRGLQSHHSSGEGFASSGVVLVTGPWFKITRSVAKIPRITKQCDANTQSLCRITKLSPGASRESLCGRANAH
ncbi:hypothetical protein TNCV_4418251 [Trichonephila clavipes]|nr:hypothetical protein TNCV_4418251 [Trichonephila clavipes]